MYTGMYLEREPMTQTELVSLLHRLQALEAETETVEFKEAKDSFSFDRIGKYFSALCNEANLNGHTRGCGLECLRSSRSEYG